MFKFNKTKVIYFHIEDEQPHIPTIIDSEGYSTKTWPLIIATGYLWTMRKTFVSNPDKLYILTLKNKWLGIVTMTKLESFIPDFRK